MIVDARAGTLPGALKTDILIIGSGAAGIALALDLAERDRDVILVEAGGDRFDAKVQDIYRAAAVTPATHSRGEMFRRRAFGGTTALWGGRCIPFDPIDFEERDWIANSGWPITHADVEPYIARAIELCDAGPPIFDAAGALPNSGGPIVDGVESPDVILDHIERFSLPTHFAKRYRTRLETAPTLRVILNAPVDRILTSHDGNAAEAVSVRLEDDRRLRIDARRVVLAAGGLETPRLLLASRSVKNCGLGNERDVVGRFYQSHIQGEVGRIVFSQPAPRIDYERSLEGVYCRRYVWLSPEAQRRERLPQMILRPHHPSVVDPGHRNAILSAMYFAKYGLLPEYARILTMRGSYGRHVRKPLAFHGAHLRNIMLGSPALASFSVKWLRHRILSERKLPSVVLRDRRNIYPVEINAEQVPDRDSRVLLAGELDKFGMPRLQVDWKIADGNEQMIMRGMRLLRDALAPSGTARLDFDDDELAHGVSACMPIPGHHIGTARMSDSAATGVSDSNGALFETKNLYIAGSALFPTGSFANPTLMIVAMALRLGDHLAKTDA